MNITNLDVTKFTSLKGFFNNQDNLISIIGLNTLDTQNVIDISYMFSGLDKLKLIDLSNFSFNDVTNKICNNFPKHLENSKNYVFIFKNDVKIIRYLYKSNGSNYTIYNGIRKKSIWR